MYAAQYTDLDVRLISHKKIWRRRRPVFFIADISMEKQTLDRAIPILSAALTGTTLMSAFSYITSQKEHRQFREPELLNKLVNRMPLDVKASKNSIVGWAVHYIVGLMFCTLYDRIWQRLTPRERMLVALPVGAVSGIIGAIVWKSTFRAHPFPPVIRYRRYYLHIILAHVIFGTFAGLGYNIAKERVFQPALNSHGNDNE